MLTKQLKLLTLLMAIPTIGWSDYLLFDPKGPIAAQQMDLIIWSFLIMMIVVIPVIGMTIWFSVSYSAKKERGDYDPHWEHSNPIEIVVWSIPLLIIIALGIITYKTSFSLDPRQPIQSEKPTMRIQVVAMDWKWLFIYPEQEIATVNELAFPVDTPVEFLITSDTVMNSFFVPQLGSMIYAMAGMENQLHLIADKAGTFRGMSAHYSGFGFSGMKFKAHSQTDQDFETWVNKVKASPTTLSPEVYKQLSVKSKDNKIAHYSSVNPLMFNRIIEKYTGVQNGQ